ncbi:MAG: cysteine peptidase family C39 domain-containing protein [Fuerstiella sp.]|nr:cysteine peptidase family C39 domain-containing protein [Fuerstiella sp.]
MSNSHVDEKSVDNRRQRPIRAALNGGLLVVVWILILFIVSCSLGTFAGVDRYRRTEGQRALDTHESSDVQRLLQSRSLHVVLVLGGLFLLPFAAACLCDEFCQQLSIELQHSAEPIVWLLGIPMFGAFAGWFTSFAIVSRDPQAGFLFRAMALMSAVLLLTGVKANAEVAKTLWDRSTADGIVLQTSHFSCVAATVANAARLCGKDVSEKEAAQLMRTTRSGTNMAGVRYGLWQLKIEHQILSRSHNQISRINFPSVLFVDHPSAGHESHALLYRQPKGDMFELWEPMDGPLVMTEEQIVTFWYGRGVECVIASSPKRKTSASITAFQRHP